MYSPYMALRRICSNAYELDIPGNLGVRPVFNVKNLTLYGAPDDYPAIIPDPSSSLAIDLQHVSVPPPPLQPLRRHQLKKIENILEDKIISTINGGFQRYLVRWKEGPESNCTWL